MSPYLIRTPPPEEPVDRPAGIRQRGQTYTLFRLDCRLAALAPCLLFLFFFVACNSLFGQETSQAGASAPSSEGGAGSSTQRAPVGHVVISWAEVAGAVGYEVLVRPLGSDVAVDRLTSMNHLKVTLKPGTYQVRVITLNIFHKAAGVSPWRYLDVIQVFKPIVKRIVPSVLYSGSSSVKVTLVGKNFIPETRIAIIHNGDAVADAHVVSVMDRRLVIDFDLNRVKPGTYDLRLANPERLGLTVPNAVDVHPRVQPELVSIALKQGYDDRTYRDVGITGQGFIAGTSFLLEAG